MSSVTWVRVYMFSKVSKQVTKYHFRVQIQVATIRNNRAQHAHSNQDRIQAHIPFLIVNERSKTIHQTILSEQIRQNPNIVPENHTKQKDSQSEYDQANQKYQQTETYQPNSILQLVWPNRKQHQRKDCHNDSHHHPLLGLGCVEPKRRELLVSIIGQNWLQNVWVFGFDMWGSFKVNQLLSNLSTQRFQGFVRLDLATMRAEQFLQFVKSEIFDTACAYSSMIKSEIVLFQKLDNRHHLFLVLVSNGLLSLHFCLHLLLRLRFWFFRAHCLEAKYKIRNQGRVISILSFSHLYNTFGYS